MKTTITKIFALVLAAAMCASLAACGKSETADDNRDSSGSVSNSPLINNAEENEGGEPEDSGTESSEEEQTPESDNTAAAEENVTGTEEAHPESTPAEDEAAEDTEAEESEAEEKDSETETSVITTEAQQTAPAGKGEAVAQTAESAVGYDYLYGGKSPEDGGFDNSGLICYAFTENGISCPRTIPEIMKIGAEVSYDGLSKGDAVFFKMDDGSDIVFGGVYAGDGKAVISFSEGIPVKLVDITTNYYRSTFLCGVRVAG